MTQQKWQAIVDAISNLDDALIAAGISYEARKKALEYVSELVRETEPEVTE